MSRERILNAFKKHGLKLVTASRYGYVYISSLRGNSLAGYCNIAFRSYHEAYRYMKLHYWH